MITIKELQLDNETALKLIKLIKKEEPEIWKVLKGGLTEALNIQNVIKSYTEKDMDGAYDKGFNDGNQRDLAGSLIEVL